jgi:TPR repeat protein
MYYYGFGVTKNQRKALKLFKKAGKGGYLKALENAGTMYYNG